MQKRIRSDYLDALEREVAKKKWAVIFLEAFALVGAWTVVILIWAALTSLWCAK